MKQPERGGVAREFVIVSVNRHNLIVAGTTLATALLLAGCGGRNTEASESRVAAEQAAARAEKAADRAEGAANSARSAAAPTVAEEEPEEPSEEENPDSAEPAEPGSVQSDGGN
jgi:hypothetical protein